MSVHALIATTERYRDLRAAVGPSNTPRNRQMLEAAAVDVATAALGALDFLKQSSDPKQEVSGK